MAEAANPYQPPEAALGAENQIGRSGNLEDAVAGRYDFTLGGVMSEAWELTKGFKGSFWGAGIPLYIAIPALTWGWPQLLGPATDDFVISILLNIPVSVINGAISFGMFMLPVRRAAALPVSFKTAFSYYHLLGPVVLAMLLVHILTYIGFALLVLPGIYLTLAYVMVIPLVVDHRLPVWQALETSRKALTHHWFKILGLYVLMGVLVAVSAIPLGIGMIWTIPWFMLAVGVLYRRIFGVAEAAGARTMQPEPSPSPAPQHAEEPSG